MTPVPEQLRLLDPERAARNVAQIESRVGGTAAAEALRHLPVSPDADMTLNNLERLTARSESLPLFRESLDAGALPTLLQLLGTSQFFADTLTKHPDFLSLIVRPERSNPRSTDLIEELTAEVAACYDDAGTLRAFRRFRQKHLLRVGVNDIIRDRPLEEITSDLSRVADASLEVAYRTALGRLRDRFGSPRDPEGGPARCSVLAFGKLGGEELNYSSDIDLMFVYDHEGRTEGGRQRIGNDDFYARAVSEVVRLLSSHTDSGQAYRVDLRLRPEGNRGPLARSLPATLHYYDQFGRTWERQALIKLRPVAGDLEPGEELIRSLEPFVYRRYLGFGEINEIKALKRQIERKTRDAGLDDRDVKTGHGGIRDIEFTIQFLQLLNGGDIPDLRQRSTLTALERLEATGCLSDQEYRSLDDSYRFLRKTEHRLQLLSDWQTHKLPDSTAELDRLARRMGYAESEVESVPAAAVPARTPNADSAGMSNPQRRSPIDESTPPAPTARTLLIEPLDRFLHDIHEKTRLNRTILEFLLHQAFAGSDESSEPETDLILTPDPEPGVIESVLGRYPFRDVGTAYRNLVQLSREDVPFLSTRRCRHFLASLAPELLRAVAETPDPDLALTNLEKVTSSLGAKAVLWELFRFNPPSLRLYVELCATAPFLSEILIANPGMIDELLDSLVLNQPRPIGELRAELDELCRGATDPEPILHSFQDKEWLRVGVRDILGKDHVRETTAALSDLAETILLAVFRAERERLGPPPCAFALLGLGKIGGRELSYHSDVDLVVVYERGGENGCGYFTELTRRSLAALSGSGRMGRLYALDLRLRPDGTAGQLAVPVEGLLRYFRTDADLWERQALTRGRVLADPDPVNAAFGRSLGESVLGPIAFPSELPDDWPAQMDEMRRRVEASAPPRNLKRGPGGMMDVEFIVQAYQYRHARPEVRLQNIWEALYSLAHMGYLSRGDHHDLREGYTFLRRVESRLRLMTNRAVSDFPDSPGEVAKLARQLAGASPEELTAEYHRHVTAVRAVYTRTFRSGLGNHHRPTSGA